jgi:hypothetical protein
MALARPMGGQDYQLKTIRLNGSLFERADDFIIAARHRQSELGCHSESPQIDDVVE